MREVLVVVPVRAGSQGIRRKNTLRVDGVPLLARCLASLNETAHLVEGVELTVVVSTADAVCAEIARVFDVAVQWRPEVLCAPDVTVTDVAAHVAAELDWPGAVAVVQVTSVLSPDTYAAAFTEWGTGRHYALETVAESSGPAWVASGPSRDKWWLFGDRVNRQYAPGPVTATPTGALRILGSIDVAMTAPDVCRFPVHGPEALDVDTPSDLAALRVVAEPLTILFVVEAGDDTGSGHLHRCLALTDELVGHRCLWAWASPPPDWAVDLVTEGNVEDVGSWDELVLDATDPPDVVVFDKLDTDPDDAAAVLTLNTRCVTLEDRGAVCQVADAVVNELYGDGPRWAVLRPEFVGPFIEPPGEGRVLVSFGGTDPAGLNVRVTEALILKGLLPAGSVTCALGPGVKIAERDHRVTWVDAGDVPVARLMRDADVVVTSYGRTVHEAAAIGRPVVAVAVNTREAGHVLPHGVFALGHHSQVSMGRLCGTVDWLRAHPRDAVQIGRELRAGVDGRGAGRLARLIETLGKDLM